MRQFCLSIFSELKENYGSCWIYLFILFISTVPDTHCKSLHPHTRWNTASVEINKSFDIDFNETTILVTVCFSQGLERFLKKHQANYTTGIQLIIVTFHTAKGRNIFILWENRAVYLVQEFVSSQSEVLINKCSSWQTSDVTVENECIFFSLIWLLTSLWQFFIDHFHYFAKKKEQSTSIHVFFPDSSPYS